LVFCPFLLPPSFLPPSSFLPQAFGIGIILLGECRL
jgi:hypothetical protein